MDVGRLMTTVKRSDPEALKLLKMELKLALAEEDYASAARIRDHPFVKLHLAAATAREGGDMEAASMYEHRLRKEIAKMEEQMDRSEKDASHNPPSAPFQNGGQGPDWL